MKLTVEKLKQIIKEEVERVSKLDEAGPPHDRDKYFTLMDVPGVEPAMTLFVSEVLDCCKNAGWEMDSIDGLKVELDNGLMNLLNQFDDDGKGGGY